MSFETHQSLNGGLRKAKGKGKAIPLKAWTDPEGSRKLKLPDFIIGNRTRNFPACSAVPQPTAPPRAPAWGRYNLISRVTGFLRRVSSRLTSVHFTIIIIITVSFIVTRLFSLALLLPNQQRSPPLNLPVSDCSTFRIVCDVPSVAVFLWWNCWVFSCSRLHVFFNYFFTMPGGPNYYRYNHNIWYSTFVVSLCINSSILVSFLLSFAWHSVFWLSMMMMIFSRCFLSLFMCFSLSLSGFCFVLLTVAILFICITTLFVANFIWHRMIQWRTG